MGKIAYIATAKERFRARRGEGFIYCLPASRQGKIV